MPAYGKTILGIVGGIGSGKSYVARLLGEMGYVVIHSDDAAHLVYTEPDIIGTLVNWYGDAILKLDGSMDRRALATRIFGDADQRARLEALVHPRIHAARDRIMRERANDPTVRGFVWDSPLLIEANLQRECDEVIFVDTPREVRLKRVQESRGWDDAELSRREASQLPLDEKRKHATIVVRGDEASSVIRATLIGALADGRSTSSHFAV